MPPLQSDAVGHLFEWAGPPTDDVLQAMEARPEQDEVPTVGSEVGRTLALCTRVAGAQLVLEHIHNDPKFETYILPVDEGLAISSHIG